MEHKLRALVGRIRTAYIRSHKSWSFTNDDIER